MYGSIAGYAVAYPAMALVSLSEHYVYACKFLKEVETTVGTSGVYNLVTVDHPVH